MRIAVDLQACQTPSRLRGVGRYSMELLRAMIKAAPEHEFLILLNGALSDTAWLSGAELYDLVPAENIYVWPSYSCAIEWKKEMGPVEAAKFFRWRIDTTTRIRKDFIRALNPDLVHVASQFEGVDSVPSTTDEPVPFAVTHYDLIPFIYEKEYLVNDELKSWYKERLEPLKSAALIFAISEYSRRELIDFTGIPGERVTNILAAVNPRFRQLEVSPEKAAEIRARYHLGGEFLLYVGGYDMRKNVERLLKAYSLVEPDKRAGVKLALAGPIKPPEKEKLERIMKGLGLGPESVAITGYVPDEELPLLYNLTRGLVFPSLHEGFGLPPLEAASSGAPVIASFMTSLPEVVNNPDALFDPLSETEIAAKITRLLTDGAFARSLSEEGLTRSKLFSWENSAKRALDAIYEWHAREGGKALRADPNAPPHKPRLGINPDLESS